MATFNQCQFIGRLGKDPVLEVTPNGKPHTKFSLAVDQGKDQPTMWLNVTCWDKLAETVEKYAHKGMQVFVQGIVRQPCREAFDVLYQYKALHERVERLLIDWSKRARNQARMRKGSGGPESTS